MRNGAGVHVKDRKNNETPLMCAINAEQKETIRALRACGAHLQMGPLELGEKLCSFARIGHKKRLNCFKLAGANLNSTNLSGQTPLHCSAETGQVKVVMFLIEEKADPFKEDVFKLKAVDIAKMLKRNDIETMLSKYMDEIKKTEV